MFLFPYRRRMWGQICTDTGATPEEAHPKRSSLPCMIVFSSYQKVNLEFQNNRPLESFIVVPVVMQIRTASIETLREPRSPIRASTSCISLFLCY